MISRKGARDTESSANMDTDPEPTCSNYMRYVQLLIKGLYGKSKNKFERVLILKV
jgi:hypothetical protein